VKQTSRVRFSPLTGVSEEQCIGRRRPCGVADFFLFDFPSFFLLSVFFFLLSIGFLSFEYYKTYESDRSYCSKSNELLT
jgi:hypothetical protein